MVRNPLFLFGLVFIFLGSLAFAQSPDYGLEFVAGLKGTLINSSGEKIPFTAYEFTSTGDYTPTISEYTPRTEFLVVLNQKPYFVRSFSANYYPIGNGPAIRRHAYVFMNGWENPGNELVISYENSAKPSMKNVELALAPEEFWNGISQTIKVPATTSTKEDGGKVITITTDATTKTYIAPNVCYDSSNDPLSRTKSCTFFETQTREKLFSFSELDRALIISHLNDFFENSEKKGKIASDRGIEAYITPPLDETSIPVRAGGSVQASPLIPGLEIVESFGKKEIKTRGISVETTALVKVERGELFVRAEKIQILPEQAIEKTRIPIEKVGMMRLVMIDEKPAYEVESKENGKLFNLFPFEYTLKVTVDATNGAVQEEKPWWAFLVGK